MIHARDSGLNEALATFRVRYTCERCAHFEPRRGGCSLGFPNEAHRETQDAAASATLVFCKAFELE
jgi:hypothetical protein